MLKKLQRRFVIWTSLAIFAVISMIVLIINISYRRVLITREDNTIDSIMSGERQPGPGGPGSGNVPGEGPGDQMEPKPGTGNDPGKNNGNGGQDPKGGIAFDGNMSPEAPFLTRYFTVTADAEKNVVSVSIDNIGSVTQEDGKTMAEEVLSEGSERGYSGEYRYAVKTTDEGYLMAFLNCSQDQESMLSILRVSIIVGASSMLLIVLALFLISRRVIAPYARNMAMQRQFITDAEHELKTPLTSIAASTDVLMMDEENEWLLNIKDQTEHMKKLVAGMLTLSRMDEESPIPDKETFSISDAAWETMQPFEMAARGLNKSFKCDIEDGMTMEGARAMIQQMMSILLDNAVKYSDDEGNIVFKVYKSGKKVHVDVSNTGDLSGIKEPERLFDRFYRPDSSRNIKTGGFGIGLSIARAVARGHKGDINVSISGNKITFNAVME